jgi:hypothetical protein
MNLATVREKQLNVRLTPEESDRFDRVAAHFGLSPAALVRMLVIEKARQLGLEPSPVAPPSRPRVKAVAKKR